MLSILWNLAMKAGKWRLILTNLAVSVDRAGKYRSGCPAEPGLLPGAGGGGIRLRRLHDPRALHRRGGAASGEAVPQHRRARGLEVRKPQNNHLTNFLVKFGISSCYKQNPVDNSE